MSWWEYVVRVAKVERQRDITDQTKVDATEVTRWKNDGKTPSPQNAAAFARGYGRPVLEAFVAAGFLTPAEAKERPAAAPDFTRLTNDELLELVRARMREEGGEGHGDGPAPTSGDGGDGAPPDELGPRRRRGPAQVKTKAARKKTTEDPSK